MVTDPSDVSFVFFVSEHECLEPVVFIGNLCPWKECRLGASRTLTRPFLPCGAHVLKCSSFVLASGDATICHFRIAAEDARVQEGKAPFALNHSAAGLVQ